MKFSNKREVTSFSQIMVSKEVDVCFQSRDYFINQDTDTNEFIVRHKQSGLMIVSFDSFLLAKEALTVLARLTQDDPIVYKATTNNPKTVKQVKAFLAHITHIRLWSNY